MSEGLALYCYDGCPYCSIVHQAIARLGIAIELRDIHQSATHRDALIRGGGMRQVPCLRIEDDSGHVEWMYESADIVSYLRARFAKAN